jgi:hypothetical protein
VSKAAPNYITGTAKRSRDGKGLDVICDCYEWVRDIPLDGISKTCPDCGQEWAYRTVPVLRPRLIRTENPQGALL